MEPESRVGSRRYAVAKIKGGWTPEEDDALRSLVAELGSGDNALTYLTMGLAVYFFYPWCFRLAGGMVQNRFYATGNL